MSDEQHHKPPGHEADEMNLKVPIALGSGVVALVVISFLIAAGLRTAWQPQPAPPRWVKPGASSTPRVTLNPRQPQQRAELQAAEAKQLSTYGWVDEPQGVAHIPIDRAMSLLVKHGLPEPKPMPTTPEGAKVK